MRKGSTTHFCRTVHSWPVFLCLTLASCASRLQTAEVGSSDRRLSVSAGGTTISFAVDCTLCDVTYRFSSAFHSARVEGQWSVSQTAVWRAEDSAELIVTPINPDGVVRTATIIVGDDAVAEHSDPAGEAAGRRVHLATAR